MMFHMQVVYKPKYIRIILNQVYIFDIKQTDFIIQKVYLANILLNFKKKLQMFYKIDLLLEHQNRIFKFF